MVIHTFTSPEMFNFKQWLVLVVCSLAILKAEGLLVNITFVRNAVAKGAGSRIFHLLPVRDATSNRFPLIKPSISRPHMIYIQCNP
ncbi:hypothetical protein YC2023_095134 [Brassica napus]